MKYPLFAVTVLALGLGGCDTRNQSSGRQGPDEFSVVPTKPLELPDNFTELPEPTPGQGNRVDKKPTEDAVVALGGNPEALTNGKLKAGESGLLTTASRYGVDPDIRSKVREDDAELRRKNPPRLLERLANTGYLRSYKDSLLDADKEAVRLRRRGVNVVSPPEPNAETE